MTQDMLFQGWSGLLRTLIVGTLAYIGLVTFLRISGKRTLATDVCVPISKLAEAVTAAQRKSRDLGLTCTIVGHVGDGNFHCGVRVAPEDADELKTVKGFVNELNDLALSLGGTVSGEHGIGIGKQAYMTREHGAALGYMRALKQAYDPRGILNPGKLLPPEEA